jgi:hypothetical protein
MSRSKVRKRGRNPISIFSPLYERTTGHVLHTFSVSHVGAAESMTVFGEPFKPTSGFRGMLMAMLTCKHVDIYGFGAHAQYGNGHYFDAVARTVLENPGHNYSIEHDFMFAFADSQPEQVRRERCHALFNAPVLPPVECGTLHMHMENAIPYEPVEPVDVETQRKQLIQKAHGGGTRSQQEARSDCAGNHATGRAQMNVAVASTTTSSSSVDATGRTRERVLWCE